MLDGNAKYQERADALKASIRKILLTYKALDQALPYDTCLQNLRKRFDRYKEASERVTHYTQELENSTSRKNQANAEVQNFLQKYQLSDDTPRILSIMPMMIFGAGRLLRRHLARHSTS